MMVEIKDWTFPQKWKMEKGKGLSVLANFMRIPAAWATVKTESNTSDEWPGAIAVYLSIGANHRPTQNEAADDK